MKPLLRIAGRGLGLLIVLAVVAGIWNREELARLIAVNSADRGFRDKGVDARNIAIFRQIAQSL